MTPELTRAVAAARHVRMTPEDRREQRINFAWGNLPEDMAGEPIELMEAADDKLRSPGGSLFD